jgi:hypothetical protein
MQDGQAALSEAFSESDWPWRVDAVDGAAVSGRWPVRLPLPRTLQALGADAAQMQRLLHRVEQVVAAGQDADVRG